MLHPTILLQVISIAVVAALIKLSSTEAANLGKDILSRIGLSKPVIKITRTISERLAPTLKSVEGKEVPLVWAARYVGLTLIALLLSASILVSTSNLCIAFPPLVLAVSYPVLALRIKEQRHVKQAKFEAPFFALYASALCKAGFNVVDAFARAARARMLFTSLSTHCERIAKYSKLLGAIKALDKVGQQCKVQEVSELLHGIASLVSSGSNLWEWLLGKSKELLAQQLALWKGYAHRIPDKVAVIAALLVVAPLIAISLSLLLGAKMVNALLLVSPIMVLGLALLAVIDIPYVGLNIKAPYMGVIALIACGLAAALFLVISIEYWKLSVIIASIGLIINGVFVEKEIRSIKRGAKEAVQLLREIINYEHVGLEIEQALQRIDERKYKSLSNAIRSLRKREDVDTGFWITNFVFWFLKECSDTGVGKADVLEELRSFISRIVNCFNDVQSKLSSLEAIMYIVPAIFAFTISVMPSVGLASEGIRMLEVLSVALSMALAAIVSKLRDFSFKSTLRVGIVGIISVISFMVLPSINIVNVLKLR